MEPPISNHDRSALRGHFRERCKPPWGFGRVSLPPDEGVSVSGVNLSVRPLAKGLTEGMRRRGAAWMWLRPEEPVLGLSDVPDLQRRVGMADMDESAFVGVITAECKQVSRDHPRLAHWVRKRIALLEYRTTPFFGLSDELRFAAMQLRQLLHRAQGLVYSDVREARKHLSDAIQGSLEGAALAAGEVLGAPPGRCPASASLMVRIRGEAGSPLPDGLGAGAGDVRARADELWRGLPDRDRLAVVVETEDAGHLGFWIPLAGPNGQVLPGAPEAFREKRASAVFVDDPPDLSSFGPAVSGRWQEWIQQHVRARLFVSIPLVVPNPDRPAERSSVAVLNVNANPADDQNWFRAYHPEWLGIVTRETSQFVEVAVNAVRLARQIDLAFGRDRLGCDLGAWSEPFPGVPSQQLRRLAHAEDQDRLEGPSRRTEDAE